MPRLDKDVEADAEVDVDATPDDKKKDRKKLKNFKRFDSDDKTVDGGKKKVAFTEIDPEKYVDLEPNTSDSDSEKNKESGDSKEKVSKVKNEAVSGDKKIAITFGRMNPPTTGHSKLVRMVAKTARRNKADAAVYLSHSEDKKKNPLSYKDKIKFAKHAFGSIVKESAARNIIEVLKELESAYTDVIIIVGSDRIREFDTLANKYNGREYKFKSIKVISAGDRDPDAEGVTGMSASKMRQMAQDGETAPFIAALPDKLAQQRSMGREVYDLVRKGMGINEATDHLGRAKAAIDREKMSDKAKHDRMLDRARTLTTRDKNKMTEEESLDEALSRAARRKRSLLMKRLSKRIAMRRKIAMRKKADIGRLKQRAHKKALLKVKHIVAGKRDYNTLSIDQKMKVDDKAKSKKGLIDRLAKRLLPQVKKAEKERMQKRMIREDGLNKSYHKGLSKSTQSKRQAQFDKQAKMSDDNPAAYKPAPGDATAKTKTSKHTKNFAKMFGEAKTPLDKKVEAKRKQEETQLKRPHQALTKENQVKFDGRFSQFKKWKDVPVPQMHEELNDLIEQVDFIFESNPKAALQKKAEKTGISYSILKQVFDRGVAAWKTGHRPGTTPAQWGLARVNSFATKSSGTWGKADKDLAAKVRKEEVKEAIGYDKRKELEWELRNEPDELKMRKRKSYRPKPKQTHTIHIKGKPWKKADNERHAQAIHKTLQKKGVDSKIVVTNEEGGAGEWGTDKLVKKYKKDTPGEK
jgi:hypothetical protein